MTEKNSHLAGSVSIYALMARLFAYMAKENIERFGKEGEAAVRAAVRKFGEDRGRFIAQCVTEAGKELTADNYLPFYDMERSELFKATDDATSEQVKQVFSECVFAKTWQELGMEELGLLYCEEIDPAIARGYHPDFHCQHDQFLLKGNDRCRFLFSMSKPGNK